MKLLRDKISAPVPLTEEEIFKLDYGVTLQIRRVTWNARPQPLNIRYTIDSSNGGMTIILGPSNNDDLSNTDITNNG